MNTQLATRSLPERTPEVGELVQVRSRRWLVDEVVPGPAPGQSFLVRLSCADDDAQGQSLDVFWDYELDRRILKEEGWQDLAAKGFDAPRRFAAFLHTLRWNCVTATDPTLFQAPFRAGIKIDAYQIERSGAGSDLPLAAAFAVHEAARLGRESSAGFSNARVVMLDRGARPSRCKRRIARPRESALLQG